MVLCVRYLLNDLGSFSSLLVARGELFVLMYLLRFFNHF